MDTERESLARYLLGRMPDAERDAIAERLIADDAFADSLEEAERDLLDAYAQHGLTPDDREAVERLLLNSTSQRQKLQFSQALAQHLGDKRPGVSRNWMGLAAMFLITLGGLAAAAYYSVANSELRERLASTRAKVPDPSPDGGRAIAPNIAAFLLSPAQRSGSNESRIDVRPGTHLVRLDFELPHSSTAQLHNVRVTTAVGDLLLEEKNVPAQRESGAVYLSLFVLADALPPGSYAATISAGGSPSPIASYVFRRDSPP
ncbi:MAG: hypothetical protein M3Z85_11245 [Acidobacteriota bacterium]|nr:hypothetical protein [Acidobacteriota bacterium]